MSNQSGQPNVIGASLTVVDSTALGALPAAGMTVGTGIYNLATGSIWTLEKSSTAPGAGVLAVVDVAGMRWIDSAGPIPGGFVTTAELASTAPTSGGTLVGINNPAARYNSADLQRILDSDMVAKADLAASDGTGGTALIASQNTGGYFGGTHALETMLQNAGALLSAFSAPASFALTVGQSLIATLTDAATNAATAVIENLKHATSGTAAAGFGMTQKRQLQNAAGTMKDAGAVVTKWTNAGAGTEASEVDIQGVTAGGALTNMETLTPTAATFPGTVAATGAVTGSNVLSTNATDIAARQTIANPSITTLSNGTVQETDLTATSTDAIETEIIEKRSSSGTPAVGMGVRNIIRMPDSGGTARDVWTEEVVWTGIGSTTASTVSKKVMYLQGLGSGDGKQECMEITGGGNGQTKHQSGSGDGTKPGISFINDGRYGMALDSNSNLSLNTSAGSVFVLSGTGLGVFSKVGTPAAPASVEAALTNNVARTGTADVLPDFTNGTVYSADYASLHATISQMAFKLTAIEASLRAMGLIVT